MMRGLKGNVEQKDYLMVVEGAKGLVDHLGVFIFQSFSKNITTDT